MSDVPRGATAFLLAAVLVAASCAPDSSRSEAELVEAFRLRNVGLARLEEGQPVEAAEAFRSLTELLPGEPLGHADLGLALLRQGRVDEAEPPVRRALELVPEDPEVRHLLATLHEAAGRRQEAVRVLEATVEKTPAHLRTLYSLAELLATEPGAANRRRELLGAAVAAAPGSLPLRLRLLEVELEAGRTAAAASHLETLLGQLGQPGDEVRSAYDQALRAARDESPEPALEAARTLHNLLRPTPAYQAGIFGLAGPGPGFTGFPIVSFRTATPRRVMGGPLPAAALRFTDAAPRGLAAAAPPGAVPLLAFDFDADGRDDLLVAGPDSLRVLRSTEGGYVEAPPVVPAAGSEPLAAAAGDVNDDGWPDLATVGRDGSVRVLLGGEGEEWREALRTPGPGGVPLLADLDHDGDLDLLVAGTTLHLYRNDGPAGFAKQLSFDSQGGTVGQVVAAALGDVDDDGDLDVYLAGERGLGHLENLRHGRFVLRALELRGDELPGGAAAAAFGDLDHDGALDVVVAGPAPGGVKVHRGQGDGSFGGGLELLSGLAGLVARHLVLLDADNDGHLDLAAAGETGTGAELRLLRGQGDGGFAPATGWLPDPPREPIERLLPADADGDGDLDLILGLQSGVRALRNDGGDANHWLKVRLVGLGAGSGKVNRLGIGSRLEVRAGPLYQMQIATGAVTHFGLGRRESADVLRVVWTNGVPQNELGPGTDRLVVEEQVLKGSCAFLYTWDGDGYRFVTDIMWRSALGMPLGITGGSAAWAPPDASREHVRLPPGSLRERDGRLSLRITEELWEVAYLDELRLVAVDHPDSVEVYANERFVPSDVPFFELHAVANARPPLAATDGEGREALSGLTARDARYVPDVVPEGRQGFVRPYELRLDLGPTAPDERLRLLLLGWVYPADASINVAVAHSGERRPQPPRLEALSREGRWVPVADVGFPAGKDKTVAVELTGKLPPGARTVRLVTGMRVHWDRALVARGEPAASLHRTELAPSEAQLRYRGFSHEYRKGGSRGPHWFDYDRVSPEPRWRPIRGSYTRYGDVRELLRSSDDRTVVMAPGDELAVDFDAAALPPLEEGRSRTFLLYSVGWIKDADLNTAEGATVEPFPFHGMSSYPPAPGESYPSTPAHRRYLEEWQTRAVEGPFLLR